MIEREPCPSRVFTDLGGAFTMGIIGGSIWHGGKGLFRGVKIMNTDPMLNFKKAPEPSAAERTFGARVRKVLRIYYLGPPRPPPPAQTVTVRGITGMTTSVRTHAINTGGGFAMWGGLFSTFDCTLAYMRRKEDPWNSIVAGALTGGLLSLRAGPKAVAIQSAIGGVLLALIEGIGWYMNRLPDPVQEQPGRIPEEYLGLVAMPGAEGYKNPYEQEVDFDWDADEYEITLDNEDEVEVDDESMGI